MKAVTQVFYGTSDEWLAQVKPLYKGVWGVEVRPDNKRVIKIGDGKRPWQLLPPLLDGDSQLGDLTGLIDQAGTLINQANILQAQIAAAQEALGLQVQQFETGKAELEQEIAAAGLVDDISVHRNGAGELYSSGTADVVSETEDRTGSLRNAPAGAVMRVEDVTLGIGAGFETNMAPERPWLAASVAIADGTNGDGNSTRLLVVRNSDGKNRFYLLKDMAVPAQADGLDGDDELLNRGEILALIDQAVNGGTA
jgi:hypothetical protein